MQTLVLRGKCVSVSYRTWNLILSVCVAPGYMRHVKCIPGNHDHALVHNPRHAGQSTTAFVHTYIVSDALLIHPGT